MKRERKEMELSSFKAIESDNGGFTGYLSPFGKLDSVGDIVMPGAYTDTIESFLRDGWIAPDHSWGYKDDCGFVTEAHEDAVGLVITTAFHPTDDAQRIRQKVQNRAANGKSVRLSIGYEIVQQRIVSGKEAVKYLINPTPEEAAACAARPTVRLLLKIKLYEGSLVSVPAASQAVVTGVKSNEEGRVEGKNVVKVEGKSAYLGGWIPEGLTIEGISFLIDRLMWCAVYDAVYNDIVPIDERKTNLEGALNDFSIYVLAVFDTIMNGIKTVPESDADALKSAVKADVAARWIERPATPTTEQKSADSSRAGLVLKEHSELVRATIEGYTQRLKGIAALRRKEGRAISGSLEEFLKSHIGSIRTLADDLEGVVNEKTGVGGDEPELIGKSAVELFMEFQYTVAQINGVE